MNNKKETITIADKVAIINEIDCIGCTKCIRACPVDAILGAAKFMHTIIRDECIGCELCIESCPVNCISMVPIIKSDNLTYQRKITQAHQRFDFREFRLQRDSLKKIQEQTIQTRKAAVQAAFLRAHACKMEREQREYKKSS